ncbi:MAG: Ldh family oxidoreductase [Patescibacteria group bacterium]|nr:Ldh family oxidoreductase [Patescibacteria group bacterium]
MEKKIKITTIKKLALEIIHNQGYDKKESEQIFDMRLYAQLRGNDHGFVGLFGWNPDKDRTAGQITIVRETKLSALIDGNANSAITVMQKATDIAIQKAKKSGFGIVGAKRTYNSTGAIGYYVKQIAQHNLIGMTFSGCDAYVAPFDSNEAIFGSNPMAVGLPTLKDPVVLDFATTDMTWHDLTEQNILNKKLAPGRGYDKSGKPTLEPKAVMAQGASRIFDNTYKGSGLSFIIETLTGPLVQAAAFGILDEEADWGNLVIAIDPELLVDIKDFKKNMTKLIKRFKGARKLKGVKELFYPGERGNRMAARCLRQRIVEIEEELLEKMMAEAQPPSGFE